MNAKNDDESTTTETGAEETSAVTTVIDVMRRFMSVFTSASLTDSQATPKPHQSVFQLESRKVAAM